MSELITGDLWSFYERGAWIGITINGQVKADGSLVMGAGVALQAARRWPDLPRMAGEAIRRDGLRTWGFTDLQIVLFPTKYHWREQASRGLIRDSADQLAGTLKAYPSLTALEPLYLAAPGCGLGGLSWAEVEPQLAALDGLRVVCVTREVTP